MQKTPGDPAIIRITPATGAQTTREIQVPSVLEAGQKVDMTTSPSFRVPTNTPEVPTEVPTIRVPTNTPEVPKPISKLQELDITVEPKEIEAIGGEQVTYHVTLDWEPVDWTGPVKIELKAEGLGQSRTSSYDYFITEDMVPPIEAPITFRVPENAPPTTYTTEIKAKAPVNGGRPGEISPQGWEEEVIVAVTKVVLRVLLEELQSPGFLGITSSTALIGLAYLLRERFK
ncbi:MAG: hypothetical protein MAG715_00562 [Methanonatronarchaeales archaeon]|nr:hypothetical protein [Methanonatronarchaeales archaeon]